MAFKKSDNNMQRLQVWVSIYHAKELRRLSKKLKLPESRLIGFAIDNEMLEGGEDAFNVDLSLPDNLEEFAYAHEAGKILNYMKKMRVGITLDLLYINRHDLGVSDRNAFLAGFAECLKQGTIESFVVPAENVKTGETDILKYRARVNNPVTRKKILKKAKKKENEYEEYLKLKKKFEN